MSNLKVESIITSDGSSSLYLADMDETYHSKHGATTESVHVFIREGLHVCRANPLSILEIGLGTGLNALLTREDVEKRGVETSYTALEPYALSAEIWRNLHFGVPNEREILHSIHSSPWNQKNELSPFFSILKKESKLLEFSSPSESFDLVYYDAFGPRAQPEMWTLACFENVHSWMKPGGILVTYCSKGQVRRDLEHIGFRVEKRPGPPGKREMIRAMK
jgi:tRNA U34 5-methylaminomethyl-2-thiouridine-forming methyltransferase MnmC